MKAWKAALLVLLALIIGIAAYGSRLIRRGFSARKEPSALERVVARTARNMAIPRDAREEENPWAGPPATPEVMADARAHWADHCATCHANDGSGMTEIGQNLYPKAPDMRLPATQHLTDGELYYIIRNGVRLTGMPAWGDPQIEQDDESWQLVLFIRHLPQITPQELEEMKRLNPKTEADRAEEQEEEEFLKGGVAPSNPAEQQHHH
jgi:mono/diheme cytochrome c family protein